MKSRFERLYENYAGKFTKGGFLPGDFVKFKAGILSHPAVAAGSQEYKDKIKELMDSDANLRISTLTNTSATKSADPNDTDDGYNVTVYQTLPGNSATSQDNIITVPLSMVDRVAKGEAESQVAVPDSFKRNSKASLNHTGDNSSTADLQDDSYDKGKSVK